MARRLFVIWTTPLFRDTVRIVLDHPDVVMLGMAADPTHAQTAIATFTPDTILLEDGGQHAVGEILQIAMCHVPRVRVIVTGLLNNRLKLFQCDEWAVDELDDLLKVVLG